MTSYHARSGPARAASLLEHLRGGADLALVTDAGTPAISDPGGELVAAWAAEGGSVVPIPGASAVLAAVAGSGVAGPRWTFEGFLPAIGARAPRTAGPDRGRRARRRRLRGAGAGRRDPRGPGSGLWRSDRPAAVCRELTKLHEPIVRGTLGELAAAVADGRIPARGEFVARRRAGRRWPRMTASRRRLAKRARPSASRPRWPRSSGSSPPGPRAVTPPAGRAPRAGSRGDGSTNADRLG